MECCFRVTELCVCGLNVLMYVQKSRCVKILIMPQTFASVQVFVSSFVYLNTCLITWQHTQLMAVFNRRLVNECGSFCVFSVWMHTLWLKNGCFHPHVIPNLTGNSSPGEHKSRYFEKCLRVFIHRMEDIIFFVANIFKISFVFCRRNCVTLILNNESPSWLFKPSISQI